MYLFRVLLYLRIIRWVVLDDPVHLRDIQPSCSYVGTQQNARVGVAELEEGGGSFGLLLFSLGREKKPDLKQLLLQVQA